MQSNPISTSCLDETRVKLTSNAYNVTMCNANMTIYSYRFTLGKEELDSETLFQLKIVGNRLFRVIQHEVVKAVNREIGSNCSGLIVDILENVIYSNVNLPITTHSSSLSIKTDDTRSFNLKLMIVSSSSFLIGDKQHSAKVLSAILQYKPFDKMVKYNQTFFETLSNNQSFTLSNLYKAIPGISMSGVRRLNSTLNLVTFNKPYGAFTKHKSLVKILEEYLDHPDRSKKRYKHSDNQSEAIFMNVDCDKLSKFSSDLDGLKCRIHLPHYKLTFRFKLGSVSADKTLFFWDEAQIQISVPEFYLKKYNIRLTYPHLPCLHRKTQKGMIYYPIELCFLIDDKIPISRVDEESEKEISRLSSSAPVVRHRKSCEAKQSIEFLSRHQMNQFNIEISEKPIETFGRKLDRPILLYGNERKVRIDKGFWDAGPFYSPAKLKNWRVVITTTNINLKDVTNFVNALMKRLTELGMDVNKPRYVNQLKEGLTKEKLKSQVDLNEDLVMFVIDNNSTQLHRLIRCAYHSGDKPTPSTTCVRVKNILGRPDSVIKSLTLKINTRLKGINVTYKTLGVCESIVDRNSLMVIGLDVTHPDHEMNFASIAGCSYTCGPDLFRHKSVFRLQKATQELIDKPDALFDLLLNDFMKGNNGRMPSRIIVYRDGVSQEQFAQVEEWEIDALDKVSKDLSKQCNQPEPSLAFVIAQKRHSMRLFSINHRNNLTNPESGTILDTDVVAPNGKEFYLFSHSCNKSTAKPTHYYILRNDNLTNKELQQLTFTLCFNFGKCASSLTIPSSLRYADTVAFEAREQLLSIKPEDRVIGYEDFKSSKYFC